MKYMLLTGLLLGSLTVQAQVSGTVKDQAGEPIIGANVFWKNISGGVATREDGTFSISKPDKSNHLIVSFIGYENDTIQVNDKKAVLDVVLREGMELSEVQIVSRKLSTLKLRSSVMNEEIITSDELCRAACCNLGEFYQSVGRRQLFGCCNGSKTDQVARAFRNLCADADREYPELSWCCFSLWVGLCARSLDA